MHLATARLVSVAESKDEHTGNREVIKTFEPFLLVFLV